MTRPPPLAEGQRAGVLVLGASGYVGGELLRWIAVHPRLDLPGAAGDDTLFVAGGSALHAAPGGGNGSASSGEEAPRPRGDRK